MKGAIFMETIIGALYVYAQENMVPHYLQTAEYRQALAGIEEGWNAFKAALTAEQGTELDALLAREIKVNLIEDEASFLAGISVGLKLGRL